MTRRPFSVIVIIGLLLAVLGGMALAAQDKYTVQVPNGLARASCLTLAIMQDGCEITPIYESHRGPKWHFIQ